jgi:regulator of sirC expression with transglutaminase-like and TPR domain
MNDQRLDSLIALLDDPDDSVFRFVLEEIIKQDISSVERLEHIWETTFDELVQKRIELIIQKIQLNDTRIKIKDWSNQKTLDLFEGVFLIARYQYPELKLKSVQNQLENIRKDVWIEFRNSLTSLEKITILNHIFFDQYKFRIDKDHEDLPQYCFINRVLDTHSGNSVSIAILYTLVARSLNLPVQYIDFDNNPLVGYFDKDLAQLVHGNNCESHVLFYINPSNKGAIIGLKEVNYIQHSEGQTALEKLSEPSTDRTIIKRLIEKLAFAYLQEGNCNEKVFYLTEIAEML